MILCKALNKVGRHWKPCCRCGGCCCCSCCVWPLFSILVPNADILCWSGGKTSLCCVVYFIGSLLVILARRREQREKILELGLFVCFYGCRSCWRRVSRSMASSSCLFFFLMTFRCQLGTRSQRQHGKCAGCDTFSLPLSQRARESHQSLTRPRSRRGNANMGKILCTFHHFPFVGIFEESVPIMQVAWTQSGQIINQCWEIKEKRKERNTAGNVKIGVTSLGRLFSICKLGGKCRCQRKCLNTRTPHTGNINISVIYTVTLQLPPALPCLMRTSGWPWLCFQSLSSLSFNLFKRGPTLHAPCIPDLFAFSENLHLAGQTRPTLGGGVGGWRVGAGFAASYAGFGFQWCTSVPLQRVWFKCRGTSFVRACVYTGGSCVPIRIPSRPCITLITWAAVMPVWLSGMCCPWGCTYVRSHAWHSRLPFWVLWMLSPHHHPYHCWLNQQRASWLATHSHLFSLKRSVAEDQLVILECESLSSHGNLLYFSCHEIASLGSTHVCVFVYCTLQNPFPIH